METRFLYCGTVDGGWILQLDRKCNSQRLSAGALYHLLRLGFLSPNQKAKRSVCDKKWKDLSSLSEALKRIAYGQVLQKLFSKMDQRWYIKSNTNEIQGPFMGTYMQDAFEEGYLYEKLQIGFQVNSEHPEPEPTFLSLENILLYFTQPIFLSPEDRFQKPIRDISRIHCFGDFFGAIVGDRKSIQTLPKYPCIPMKSLKETSNDELDVQRIKTSAMATIEYYSNAARVLFTTKPSFWYYLGQKKRQTIHGPFDGPRMYTWFQRGWLSLDLPIWNTKERIQPFPIESFKSLKERLDNEIALESMRCCLENLILWGETRTET